MSVDDNSTPFKGRRPVFVRPVEHVLWTLRKGSRLAEARTRGHPLGLELVFYVDDQLVWSQVYREGSRNSLGELAASKRREFESLGWRVS